MYTALAIFVRNRRLIESSPPLQIPSLSSCPFHRITQLQSPISGVPFTHWDPNPGTNPSNGHRKPIIMNPSSQAQPPQDDPEQIVAYIESIMYQFKDSINAKDFRMPDHVKPGEPPSIWRYMADYFDTEQDLVQKTQATTPGPSKFGLKETLESYKMAGAAYPDFTIEVKEMKTDLDAKAGWATVFVNLESSGQWCESSWLCVE